MTSLAPHDIFVLFSLYRIWLYSSLFVLDEKTPPNFNHFTLRNIPGHVFIHCTSSTMQSQKVVYICNVFASVTTSRIKIQQLHLREFLNNHHGHSNSQSIVVIWFDENKPYLSFLSRPLLFPHSTWLNVMYVCVTFVHVLL